MSSNIVINSSKQWNAVGKKGQNCALSDAKVNPNAIIHNAFPIETTLNLVCMSEHA
ncbi:hypothetical protein J3L16_07890 [Alteromonas sp. 5E99-2]|uniref:hypothetical protein n=1 Tax=Alteromonas sp. 5E99-2 TaxID=2817683 RepID=UPI001A98F95E|nr:hypothetical protein [Alteromonas sp. 5E99-2]MBO1255601.1 hypothetical protein [Alteromonas sp. 5E99-2]